MSKSIDPQWRLDLAVAKTGGTLAIAVCWEIERVVDGSRFFFTDHDRPILFEGNSYLTTTGFNRSALKTTGDLAAEGMSVVGIFDSGAIRKEDLVKGLFDGARVKIFLLNYENPAIGRFNISYGRFGAVSRATGNSFKVEFRDLTQLLNQEQGELRQPTCRANLGDVRCNNADPDLPGAERNPVPIEVPERLNSTAYVQGDVVKVRTLSPPDTDGASFDFEDRVYRCTVAGTSDSSPPAMNTTPGQTTSEGGGSTLDWTAEVAYALAGEVLSSADNNNFQALATLFTDPLYDKPWFNLGAVVWESGANKFWVSEVKQGSPPDFKLKWPTSFAIQPGDKFRVFPGCNRRHGTCKTKFDQTPPTAGGRGNLNNFRGEPHLAGLRAFLQTPNAKV